MRTHEKVIEIIGKLFEYDTKKGATEAEVQAAVRAAQRLMAQHGITEEEVELSKAIRAEKGKEEIYSAECGYSVKPYAFRLAQIIADNFRCVLMFYKKRREVIFHGYETDARIALKTFQELHMICETMTSRYIRKMKYKTGYETGHGNSFRLGFVAGVEEALKENVAQYSLMVIPSQEVKDSIKNVKEGTPPKTNLNAFDYGDFKEGKQAGKDSVTIGRKLEAGNKKEA